MRRARPTCCVLSASISSPSRSSRPKEGTTARTFRVRGTRVLVEFDGAVKYADARALFEEKQREDALRRAGWVVVRVVWSDLGDPARLRRRLQQAMAQAAA